ncbi:hypothetical protein [Oscillibacter sp.]|uniref:hypothetical protein n=1 Tax=Oscillibacter sp. TaxID=1945593 RepID=UPI0028AD05C4|nr:hypothetical protein [Oscillibacter sp.]
MKNEKCLICDYVDENHSQETTCCPRCGTDFKGNTVENKLMSALGTYTTEDKQFFGKLSTTSYIYLTDRRLLAIPEKLEGFNLKTSLTAAIVNKMTSKNGVISIPLEQIKAVRDGKFGLLQKAVIIDTTNDELLKITVSKRKEWKEAIMNAAANLRRSAQTT